MFHVAARMVGRRISALVALGCAVLGGAALVTGTGVLAESGLRSHLPAGRLAGADVVVAADQEFRPSADLPIALPERRTIPTRLVGELAALPGVTAAVGDIAFPAALIGPHGRLVVPSGDPQESGHGWSSTRLLGGTSPADDAGATQAGAAGGTGSRDGTSDGPRVNGRAPAGPGEIAMDKATAVAADVHVGDRVRVVADGRPATGYRVSAVIDTRAAGLFFADPTAAGLAARTHADTAARSASADRPATGRPPAAGEAPTAHPQSGQGVETAAGSAPTGRGDSSAVVGDRTGASGSPAGNPGRTGGVGLIGLRAAPGATSRVVTEVRTRLKGTGLVAVTGAGRGDLVSPGAGASRSRLVLLAGSLAGIVLLITGFVVAGALAVLIAGQRRDLALMRAVGATPRQIRRLAAAQSTVIAAAALVPGVALGYLLVGRFRRLLADHGVIPPELPVTISLLPALGTTALMAVMVQVSARASAWRTSRMRATEAVAESRSEPRTPSRARTGTGLLIVLAATAMSVLPLFSRTVIGASATSIAGILGAIGLALAGPALVRGIGAAASRRTRSGASASTWLAMANVRAYAVRNAGIVSALAMAVVFVLTYTFAQTTALAATARDVSTGTLAQQRLTAPELGGLPDGTLAAVRHTPGVRAAAPVGTTTVVWSYRQFGDTETDSGSAMILTPDAQAVLDLDVREGSLDRLTGDAVAVSSDVARSRGAEPGRRIRLVLGDGTPVEPLVVAVYGRGLGFGTVVLSHDLAAGHTTTGLDQSILIGTDGTGGTGAALRGLRALASAHPGLTLTATHAASVGRLKDAPPEVWINLVAIMVLLVYLLLSIANKSVAATAQRRVEMGALRLSGTTPRQIRAMMRREAAVTAATALVTALLLSAVPLALLGQGFLGRPWPAGPAWLLPALALVVTATAFLTVEIPTRRALRTAPAEAIRAL